MADWERLVEELAVPDPDDTLRLIEHLAARGAAERELRDAVQTGSLGSLALELALRPPGETVDFQEAARRAGLESEEARLLWRALGFPDPVEAAPRVTNSSVATLRVLAEMSRSLFGFQTALRLARVIGSSAAQLAEAIVDSFRVDVEMPRRDRGEPYSEVVESYVRTAEIALPALTDAIGDVLAGHLLAVSRASWGLDEQRAAITRRLAIGFTDLVGYTPAARTQSPAELAAAIDGFESRTAEIVSRHRGRVVKLIGDEVMFALEDPREAIQVARDLVRQDPHLPAVRVGLAAGPVVSRRGDYYGDVVNLAARLVKAARPGTALVSDSVAPDLADEMIEITALKGYAEPARAYELTPTDPASGR